MLDLQAPSDSPSTQNAPDVSGRGRLSHAVQVAEQGRSTSIFPVSRNYPLATAQQAGPEE